MKNGQLCATQDAGENLGGNILFDSLLHKQFNISRLQVICHAGKVVETMKHTIHVFLECLKLQYFWENVNFVIGNIGLCMYEYEYMYSIWWSFATGTHTFLFLFSLVFLCSLECS